MSIGTGVGLALVLDGRLRSGATRSAGEIGYLPLQPSPAPLDPAPARSRRPATPVLEEVAAAAGVVAAARRLGLRASTAQAVFELARAGDVRALQVAREQAAHLALGVVAVSAVVDPGLVVVSGGLGIGAADVLLPLLDDAVRRLGPLRPPLVVSELGDHAVLDGAVVAAVEAAREQVLGRATGHHTSGSPGPLPSRQVVPSLPLPAASRMEAL